MVTALLLGLNKQQKLFFEGRLRAVEVYVFLKGTANIQIWLYCPEPDPQLELMFSGFVMWTAGSKKLSSENGDELLCLSS